MPDHRTTEALDELKSYTTNETNEPPSFSLNRLTGDLFTNSFLGGGALINPSGDALKSEDSVGWVLDSEGGAPNQFTIDEVSIDLGTAKLTGGWTLPDGTSQTPTFELHCVGAINGPVGREVFFRSGGHADGAAYSLVVLLL
jgi:hypothetical protein